MNRSGTRYYIMGSSVEPVLDFDGVNYSGCFLLHLAFAKTRGGARLEEERSRYTP